MELDEGVIKFIARIYSWPVASNFGGLFYSSLCSLSRLSPLTTLSLSSALLSSCALAQVVDTTSSFLSLSLFTFTHGIYTVVTESCKGSLSTLNYY